MSAWWRPLQETASRWSAHRACGRRLPITDLLARAADRHAIAIWLPDTPIEWRDVWLRPDRSAATDAKSPAAAIERSLFMGHVLGIDGTSAVQPGNVPPSCRFRAINGFECSTSLPAGGRSAAAHRPAPPEWGDLHRAAPGNRRERGRVSQPLRTAVGDLLILAQGP
jgi:hypothetical protein